MRDLELRGAGNLLGDEQSGHVAALGFELYMQMLDEAVRAAGPADGGRRAPSPCASTSTSTPTSPPTTSPTSRRRSTCTAAIAGAREVGELGELRDELEDRFGPVPEPLENLLALQQARIKLGQAGARAVTFTQGRLAVTPIELDAARQERLREELPEARYESGRSQLSLRVPEEPPRSASRRSSAPPTACSRRSAPRPERGHDRESQLGGALPVASPYTAAGDEQDSACSPGARRRFFRPRPVPRRLRRELRARAATSLNVDGTTTSQETFDHWLNDRRAVGRRPGGREGRHPGSAGLHEVHRRPQGDAAQAGEGPAEADRRAATRSPASSSTTSSRARSCRFLIRAAVARGRGRAPGHQGQRQGGQEVVRQGAQDRPSRGTRPTRCSSRSRARREADLLYRQRTQLIEQKITEKLTKGTTDVSQARRHRVLQQEQEEAVHAAGDARPARHPDEDRGAGEGGQGGARGRPAVRRGRARSTRPTRRRRPTAASCLNVTEGQGEKAFDKAVFERREGQGLRPGQDERGLLRLRGHPDHPGEDPAARQPAARVDQADHRVREPAQGADDFGNEYQDRWRGETECAKGYTVPDCANAKTKPASTVPPGAVPQPTAAPQSSSSSSSRLRRSRRRPRADRGGRARASSLRTVSRAETHEALLGWTT